MQTTELLAIIKAGEGTSTEFKQELDIASESAKKEFAKDLSAMANTGSEKGFIIYGVTDDGKIVGITRKRRVDESLIQIASSRIEPPVDFEPIWRPLNGSLVLTLVVPRSRKRPHWIIATRDTFIRRDKVVDKVHPKELEEMLSHKDREELVLPEEINHRYSRSDRLVPSFFMLTGLRTPYRTCKKSGPFSDRFSPPVFEPLLTILIPTPEFGYTKSAISFETGVYSRSVPRNVFILFLKALEQRIPRVATQAGIWDSRFPIFWSLSGDEDMDYGVGAESVEAAIQQREEGVLACAIQFSRFNVYKPTCLLLFYASYSSRKNEDSLFLDNCWMKLLSSSLPLNPKWVQKVFDVFRGINSSFKPESAISDALIEHVSTSEWETTGDIQIRSRIFGFMGRERSVEPMYDQSLGLVIDAAPFRNAKWVKDDEGTWNFDYYARKYDRCPVLFLEELPVRVTNPVPAWLDIKGGHGEFGRLRIRQIVVEGPESIMSVLGAHSALVKFK